MASVVLPDWRGFYNLSIVFSICKHRFFAPGIAAVSLRNSGSGASGVFPRYKRKARPPAGRRVAPVGSSPTLKLVWPLKQKTLMVSHQGVFCLAGVGLEGIQTAFLGISTSLTSYVKSLYDKYLTLLYMT